MTYGVLKFDDMANVCRGGGAATEEAHGSSEVLTLKLPSCLQRSQLASGRPLGDLISLAAKQPFGRSDGLTDATLRDSE